MPTRIKKSYYIFLAVIGVVGASCALLLNPERVEAACPAVDTSRGTVTSTITVPSSGTYKVWSRMQASSSSNDSFILQIDDSICGVVVGDTAVPSNEWKWVDYRSGNTSNKITVNLSAGAHTVTMIGREDSVKVDKLLFLSDQSCVPQNFGENCEIVQDTTAPTVTMTQPTTGSSINGSVNLQATATDDTGVTKVDFYLGDTKLTPTGTKGQGNAWGMVFDSSKYQNGSYNITAIAYDAAGNQTRSSVVTVSINNPIPDTTPPALTITSPRNNDSVSGTIQVSATASDASGIKDVKVFVDNNLKATLTSAPYTYSLDTRSLSEGNRTIKVEACDKAQESNCTSQTVVVNVNNATPVYTAKDADTDKSGKVDGGDLSRVLWFMALGEPVEPGTNGDASGNGIVDGQDLSITLWFFGDDA